MSYGLALVRLRTPGRILTPEALLRNNNTQIFILTFIPTKKPHSKWNEVSVQVRPEGFEPSAF